jgi:hypothetical protein
LLTLFILERFEGFFTPSIMAILPMRMCPMPVRELLRVQAASSSLMSVSSLGKSWSLDSRLFYRSKKTISLRHIQKG